MSVSPNQLQPYITAANAAQAAGNSAGVLQNLSTYYGLQASTRAYAADAVEVINNTGVYGVTANNEVSNAMGAAAWNAASPQVALALANQDWNVVSQGITPNQADIENAHATVFGQFGIPLTAWGGSSFAALGMDWLQGGTAAELSGGHSTAFSCFTPLMTETALGQVENAGIPAGLNFSSIGDTATDAAAATGLLWSATTLFFAEQPTWNTQSYAQCLNNGVSTATNAGYDYVSLFNTTDSSYELSTAVASTSLDYSLATLSYGGSWGYEYGQFNC